MLYILYKLNNGEYMKKKFFIALILIFIVPCVMLLGACFNENVYITNIEKNSKGGYTVSYSNGTTSQLDSQTSNTITTNYTINELKEEWQLTAGAQDSFTDFLMENTHLTLSYNIGVAELKEAWQEDYNNGKTTKSFSEFLASFANIGEGYGLTASINNTLFNSVSIVCNFTYTSSNPWTGDEEKTTSGAGSGVIYKLDKANKEAFILTNYHVVYDSSNALKISDDIRICLYGNENFANTSQSYFEASFLGGSSVYDIAVLKVTAENKNSDVLFNSICNPVTIENSNNVYVGEEIYAVGNAQGYGISAVSGIVSVDSENIVMNSATQETSREIRITAPVNPGNSGGGLFNSKGKLIGIVNAKIVDESVEGIGYAIPINVAKAVADNIIYNCNGTTQTTGKFVRVGLTIGVQSSSAVIEQSTNLVKIVEKIYVVEIAEGSLSAATNLQVGDLINSVKVKQTATSEAQELDVTRIHILTDAVLSCFIGGSIELNVTHTDSSTENITIVFTEDCLKTIN